MPRLHTIKKLFVREFDVFRTNKSHKQASSVTQCFWRFALWRGAGVIPWFFFTNLGCLKLFVLQFWLCRCNFPQWGAFPLQPQESPVPSPCNLQAGLFLPSPPECLSIMQHVVSLNRCPRLFAKGGLDLLVRELEEARRQCRGRAGVKTGEDADKC